ncbi:MAG: fatty acid desaturase [Pseudomonadota bacterium]
MTRAAPTWAALVFCYGLWAASLWLAGSMTGGLSALALVLLTGPAITLHASLQHEALHGHPTRSALWNEALVFPALNLLFPYRRFKTLHLRHHRDERLTDPYEDPESFYLAEAEWTALPGPLRTALRANATLLGRLVLGPWLGAIGMWRADRREAAASARARAMIGGAYLRHLAGAALALGIAWGAFGVSPAAYLLFAAWPGVSLLMLRTYAEHRAAERVGARTAIVEAETPLAFLFLNNNLHAVHHAHPRAPWFALPGLWRAERRRFLAENDGYLIGGYREIAARWLLRAKEPVVHPILRRGARR